MMVGFAMVVGPREGGIATDTIRSILNFYPQSKIWIRDDATTDGTFEQLQSLAASAPHRIDLTRNPHAMGLDGIAVSTFRLFQHIANAPEKLEMVIQLDPDVCIVREGLVEFARKRFAVAGPGILGSYTRTPDRRPRSHRVHARAMLRDLLPVDRDRGSGRLRAGLPFYLRFLPRAFRSGYKPGHHVLAAFYIVHGETLYALARLGFWSSIPKDGSRSVKPDDPLVSLGAYAVGHRLIDIHEEDGRSQVWIQHRAPVPLTAEEIHAHSLLAVHPLKQDEASMLLRNELKRLTLQ
ncbi:glycosyl transferase family 2 [Acidipila rosea]|uniref:Glycosyl transferase family 2 n=2 Tax=Acidipila rosea TaxID=768535 RepID=A0A4R1L103_9BACT|nr:glycosyl transferase family 2 [Acidipila rosea]